MHSLPGSLRSLGALLILLVGGCDDPASPGPVSDVIVTVDMASVHPGDALAFTARAVDASGRATRAGDVVWSSSAPARLALVADGPSAAGEALGVEERVTVTATVGGVSGAVIVSIVPMFTSIEPGNIRNCGLAPDGLTFCWGRYDGGADIAIPKRIAGNTIFREIASSGSGRTLSCGLTPPGAAYCWDFRNMGVPVRVGPTLTFASLARGVGFAHRCALTAGGVAYCWGSNERGQLGNGTTSTDFDIPPALVAGNLRFTSMFVGGSHSCGLVASGEAYCWGGNDEGQLGDGTTDGRTEPVAVLSSLRFTRLAAGGEHTCGLIADGTAYCWGKGEGGAIGDGSTTRRLTPTAVAGRLSYVDIGAGGFPFTCGLRADGIVMCWGQNAPYGLLGSVGAPERLFPWHVGGGHQFAQLRVGHATSCGITVSGRAMCWGAGSNGQLGDGSYAEAAFEPVYVARPTGR
jgi:hypothetical protein